MHTSTTVHLLNANFADQLVADRISTVTGALREDVGAGDITAQLIPANASAEAVIISRQAAVLCGREWVEEVFFQLSEKYDQSPPTVHWHASDGDPVVPDSKIVTLKGNARTLLTGERCALNFLQTLSATATQCAHYAKQVEGFDVQLLDTRKTIPGLRTAQKYAVTCGHCYNHRIGLYDAFLIKENHIAAAGGLSAAIAQARLLAPKKTVEVEVETLEQLKQALSAHADIIMLDNFTLPQIRQAVRLTNKRAKLEISGNVNLDNLKEYAKTGVDFISIGGLTKHLQAIDLSMRFIG